MDFPLERKYNFYEGRYYYFAGQRADNSLVLVPVDWSPSNKPLKEELTDRIGQLAFAFDIWKDYQKSSVSRYEAYDPSIKLDPVFAVFTTVTTAIPMTKPIGLISVAMTKINAWYQQKQKVNEYNAIIEQMNVESIVMTEIESELDARITQLKSLDPLNTENYLEKVQKNYLSQKQTTTNLGDSQRSSIDTGTVFAAILFFLAAYIVYKGFKKKRKQL